MQTGFFVIAESEYLTYTEIRQGLNKGVQSVNNKDNEIIFGVLNMSVLRGEIYYADLSPVVGSEQGGIRPVLIVQNDVGNRHSPTVIAAAITSQRDKTHLPTHIEIDSASCGLAKDSIVLLEQIRTLDKKRLKERMGALDSTSMGKIDTALSISFGLS